MDHASSHLLAPSDHDGAEVKVAAAWQDTNSVRLRGIAGQRPKVADYLRNLIVEMERAHAEGKDLNALITKAYEKIEDKLEDGDLKDRSMEVINDTYQGLRGADPNEAPAAATAPAATGPRPMAAPQAQAEDDPCATFPDGGKDVESIFSHMNDVASTVVPPFGISALQNPASPERLACTAAGLSEEWFRLRADARYIELMGEIRNGARKIFDKSADWDEGGQRFFANFFSKNGELLPLRVKHLRENMPRARGPVAINDRFMNTRIPDSEEVVAFSLLCHFSNLLQNGNPQAKAAAFSLAVDRHRKDIGINVRMMDEAELARQQGRGREEERGMGAVGDQRDTGCAEDDFGCAVNQFVGQANQVPPENDMGGALNILRQFQVDVTNKIDSQLSAVQSIHQKLVELIGGNVGARRQVSWTLMEPLLASTLTDAEMAKTKMFNSIAALLSAAQRGHSMPALQWLQSRFNKRSKSITEKHGTMEAYVEVETDQAGMTVKVVEASVRVNLINPPEGYAEFAPGGDFYEFTRTRRVEDRSRRKTERTGLVEQIKEGVDAAAPGDVAATFAQLVNSPEVAKAIRIPAKDAVQRRWTKSMEGVGNLLQEFEGGQIDAQGFAERMRAMAPYRGVSVADSIREVLDRAIEGHGRVRAHKAREKVGELARAIRQEGGAISREEVFILSRYLNALISPKLKINREADVRSEIIKIARRLFLA